MHAGIADEQFRGHVAHEPAHCGVGQRPVAEFGFGAAQIGTESAVEAKNRAGGESALPQVLAVGQGREIENSVAFSAVGRERTVERCQRVKQAIESRYSELAAKGLLISAMTVQDKRPGSPIELVAAADMGNTGH